MSAVLEKIDKLPDGWRILAIEEIAEVNPRVNKSEISDGLAVSFVPMHAVEAESGAIDVSQERPFSEVKKGFTPFLEGDVLFAKITPCMENGKMAVVPKVRNGYGFGSTEFHVLRSKEGIESKYIYYFVSSRTFRGMAQHNMSGAVGQKRVPVNYLKQHLIPVAPPEQQKRIVAKIEELFSHIDAGIEALKKAKQLLKQYRQSVLKAAVTGELTKEWREANKEKFESANQLLKAIEKQRQDAYEEEIEKWNVLAKRWRKSGSKEKKPAKPKKPKIIEPLSDEEVGELHSLPNGWLWVKLSQLATKITDGEHFKPQVEDDGVYFLSAKDVRDEGVSFENPLYISEEIAEKALLRCNPENGDILIVSRGATVGRMCVVNTNEVFCLLGSVILIKVAEGINSEYLMNLMKSPDINRKISNVSGATAQQAIYLSDIQHIAIPLCSLEEQIEIGIAVNGKTDTILGLEKEINSKLVMAENNKQSVLASAFTGRLLFEEAS